MSEHAVIVHLSLGGDNFGAEVARDAVRALEREIKAVLDAHDLGALDGDDFGGGEAILYLYGADADSLFGSIEPLLLQSQLGPAHAILRYGEASDAAARERRVEI